MSGSLLTKVWVGLTTIMMALPMVANSADFRSTRWGMSKQQVKQAEKDADSLVYEDKENLVYSGKVSGFTCGVVYLFYKDSLFRGGYSFTHDHSNAGLYRDDFITLKEKLTAKYGPPTDDNEVYTSPYEKGDGYFGTALKVGKAQMQTAWQNVDKRTSIWLELKGDNYKVTFKITYESLGLAHLLVEKKAKEDSEDL